MPSVIVYDNTDSNGALLSPLTDLRPVFNIRTGALTTFERLMLGALLFDTPAPDALIVPERLAALTREMHGLPVNDRSRLRDAVYMVNGACPHVAAEVPGLELGSALVDTKSGAVIFAHVRPDQVDRVLANDTKGLRLAQSAHDNVLSRPWHIRALRDECIHRDLHWLISAKTSVSPRDLPEHRFRTFASPSATIHASAILDFERGHIFIDDHATIRPGAIIVGPAYIGKHSTVLERAIVKANTAIGPHCKVAGEIGGTIFQGYANKAHEGHLGDSWVGEWANLGAGTTNSNLLNTYGDVVCRPLGADGKPATNERTGQQFLGATIGDHVKTAICTRIMTGAIVGTGTMFAATAALSGTVPSFSWITDSGTRAFAMDKFLDIAKTVMARRKITPSEAYLSCLRART